MEPRPKKLLDRVREAIQRKHYSPRTAESYVGWIRRFSTSSRPDALDACYVASWHLPRPD